MNIIKLFADATVTAAWVAVQDSDIKNRNIAASKVYVQRITATTGTATFISTNYSSITEARRIITITHELRHPV